MEVQDLDRRKVKSTTKISVFGDVTLCQMVNSHQCSEGSQCLHPQSHEAQKEYFLSSTTLVTTTVSKLCNIPQDKNLQQHH
jgi:hypothetical protein